MRWEKNEVMILLSLGLMTGCIATPKIKNLEMRTTQLQDQLLKKDEEIKILKDMIKNNETLIKEKDLKIEELGKKLESLGVFEK
jgi:hypothetical protein